MPDTEETTTETVDETTATDPTAEVEKWKGLARKHETRAKENADKAKRFDALEAANKTELELATARAEAAERALSDAELNGERLSIALAKGLSPELAPLLSGATKEEIEAHAELLAKHTTPAKSATTKPAAALKSGATAADNAGLTGPEKAAAAVRQLRGVNN